MSARRVVALLTLGGTLTVTMWACSSDDREDQNKGKDVGASYDPLQHPPPIGAGGDAATGDTSPTGGGAGDGGGTDTAGTDTAGTDTAGDAVTSD